MCQRTQYIDASENRKLLFEKCIKLCLKSHNKQARMNWAQKYIVVWKHVAWVIVLFSDERKYLDGFVWDGIVISVE